MTWPIILTIPYDPQKLSPNRRLHWRERHLQSANATLIALNAWRNAGEPKSTVPVRVHITARRARAVDCDNLVSGCKALLDGVLNGSRFGGDGVTPDDSPRWVALGGVDQQIARAWKGREQVVLTITPREELGE